MDKLKRKQADYHEAAESKLSKPALKQLYREVFDAVHKNTTHHNQDDNQAW